jgi:THO complex subunit 2
MEPQSPLGHRGIDDKPRADMPPTMPPPSVPSQTPSAQELRETAKQSMARSERLDAGRNAAPSPRARSSSPTSRPGTRNPSVESRGSGGRLRSDRVNPEVDRDDRRAEREGRQDSRDHAALGRRDSLTHNRERVGRERVSTRESDKDSEREKDRDRGRERHGERERDRDRDRDTERVRDRERDRDRDRERDRDRHRRDDKERERDGRKDRDSMRSQVPIGLSHDDRMLPSRPDPSRHRSMQGEDGLGKRRRPTDDEVSDCMIWISLFSKDSNGQL